MDRTWPTNVLGKSPQPAPGSRSAFLTYEPYYGLEEKPFSISDEPRSLYKSPSHAATLDDLLMGIRRREGLIVLTGDIGTGKTTLCKAALSQLDRKTFSTFIPDPFVSREDLLKMLLIDFGVMSIDDLKSGRLNGASRPDLSYPLYEFLKSLLPLNALAVLVIDEAQNLSVPLLEELRILSDLAVPEKLLQIVLVGQLEFRTKLKLPEMRQLDQRVSVRCNLEPLNAEGVAGYVMHRLTIAGATADRVEFAKDAVEAIARASGGVPRLINLICDRALYRGYLARARVIDAGTVSLAVADLGVGTLTPPPAAEPVRDAHVVTQHVTPQVTQPALTHVTPPAPPHAPQPGPQHPPSGLLLENVVAGDMADLEVDGLHEDPLVEAHQPIKPESLPGPVTAAPVNTRLRLGESMSASRWRRRVHRFAKISALVLTFLLVLFSAEIGWMHFGPQLVDESPLAPAPSAPSKASSLPLAPPALPGQSPAASPDIVPAPPVAPTPVAAAGPGYAIDVALFGSHERAAQLVAQLSAAGYAAYEAELSMGSNGSAYVVFVGDYKTPEEAEGDLARIREIPGYADARTITAPSKPVR